MSDDLFERLRAVDPATKERIALEARGLGTTPERIVETEQSNARRFPTSARRKATLVAVAAVLIIAIALPLTLLRRLGDGDAPAPTTGSAPAADWVTVGTLSDIRQANVVFLPELSMFVVASPGAAPYALRAGTSAAATPTPIDQQPNDSQRALYCRPTGRFMDPRGNVFDARGSHLAGPDPQGLLLIETRVNDGLVQIQPLHPRAEARTSEVAHTLGADCMTADGVPLEGEPGFGIPEGTELPPIAVGLPQRGTFLQSPVKVTGSSDVFEATVSVRVLDETGTTIAEQVTTATCGTGCRGDFSTEVGFTVDHEQGGTVQVFEVSAKDGSTINMVEIPVTLVPDVAPAPDGFYGTWFDTNGQPLSDSAPPDMGGTSLVVFQGAGHCGWMSASFMYMAWPVEITHGDRRQYVRDPEGLFDDGALHIGYLDDTTLPPDATDTGYHRGPWRLWVSPSQAADAIYLASTDTGEVERWGRATPPILCD